MSRNDLSISQGYTTITARDVPRQEPYVFFEPPTAVPYGKVAISLSACMSLRLDQAVSTFCQNTEPLCMALWLAVLTPLTGSRLSPLLAPKALRGCAQGRRAIPERERRRLSRRP